jgi:hypothetical protein
MSLKHWQSSPLPWPNKMLSSGQNSHRNILRTRTLPRFVISREPQKEWDAEMTYDDIAALTFDIKCHSRAVDFKQVLRAAWFGLFRAVLSIPANESSCSELRMGESCSRDFFSQHRRNKKSVITSTRETSDYHACPWNAFSWHDSYSIPIPNLLLLKACSPCAPLGGQEDSTIAIPKCSSAP